jgi:hypothetical protein
LGRDVMTVHSALADYKVVIAQKVLLNIPTQI